MFFAKKQGLLISFIFLIVFAMSSSVVSTASANTPKDDSEKVIMFSLPRTTWKQLLNAQTPNIDRLIERGAVASMSARVLGAAFTQAKGYATISAGARSTAPRPSEASFISENELFNGREGFEQYIFEQGEVSEQNPSALAVGWEIPYRDNKTSLDQSRPGLFSEILKKNGRSIAVFGNADNCLQDNPLCFDRSIAFLGTNTNGVLKNGDISRALLETNSGSVSEIRIDNDVVSEKAKESIANHDVTAIECSDLERVESFRATSDVDVAEDSFRNALEKCDDLIGDVLQNIDLEKDKVFIFSPSPPLAQEEKVVFIAAGKSVERGYATSATTRIKGAVTLVDIAPSVLSSFSISIPSEMNNTFFDWQPSSESALERQEYLINMNDQALARENALTHVNWFVVLFFAFVVLFSMLSFSRSRFWKSWATFLSFTIASIGIATFLIQPFMVALSSSLGIIAALVALSCVFGVMLYLVGRKYTNKLAFLLLCGSYLGVLLLDIMFLETLHFNSIYGNATIIAGRFTGVNNQSFTFVAIAMIIFVALFYQLFIRDNSSNTKFKKYSLVALMGIVIIAIGAPQMGADVGGVLALTPIVFIISLLIFEKRINLKSLIISGLVTFMAISIFAAIDLLRPVTQRSHLGRYAQTLIEGEGWLTIERKLNASIRSFSRIILVLLLAIAIIFLIYAVFDKSKQVFNAAQDNVAIPIILLGSLLLSFLGAFLNDSGATIPALMSLVLVPMVIVVTLENKMKEDQSEKV